MTNSTLHTLPIEPVVTWCDEIAEIEHAAAVVPWTADNLRSCFCDGYTILGIKAKHGELLAFIIVQQLLADEWTIMDIAVHPKAQRHGLGGQLVTAVIEAADAANAELLLEVRASNRPALALYQQAGFEQVGQRKDYYPNPDGSRELAVIMSRKPQLD